MRHNHVGKLKERLLTNALFLCEKESFSGVERESAFLFNDLSMNFHPDSFENILKTEEYKKRLEKRHTQANGFKELQSSNSSDALLMNFFAHPKIQTWKSLRDLLSIDESDSIEFGWCPSFPIETKNYRSEIDMKIGNVIFEAKLIEGGFTHKKLDVVLGYPNVENIIDLQEFIKDDFVTNYQLIRNLLAAEKHGSKFYLLLDESRTDLIREFYKVKFAIKDKSLAHRFNFVSWQELASNVGRNLRDYIIVKYF